MNARRAPQGVLDAHLPDQSPKRSLDRRTANAEARFPPPIPAEASAVPPDKRVGANDQNGPEDRRKQPIEPDEEKAIAVRRLNAAAQLTLQHDDLLPECRVLRCSTMIC